MPWITPLLDELAACRAWTYHADGPISTEPAALTALALIAHDRADAAAAALDWMAKIQGTHGSLGVTAEQSTPTWATSLAVVAWSHYLRAQQRGEAADAYRSANESASAYLLTQEGTSIPRNVATGHDTTLIGWSWAAATHSWIEPTAMHVWALKTISQREHPRTREAVRLLINRQIPGGGCNYGNTFVLGQKLIPHFQPTAISLLALADEAKPATKSPTEDVRRCETSVNFLARSWPSVEGTPSVCYAAMALAAYDRLPTDLEKRLQELVARRRPSTGTYPLSLVALAAAGRNGPLANLARTSNAGQHFPVATFARRWSS